MFGLGVCRLRRDRRSAEEDWERVGRLLGEVKVNMCLDVTERVRVCADGTHSTFGKGG
jgi:hypothetical protein